MRLRSDHPPARTDIFRGAEGRRRWNAPLCFGSSTTGVQQSFVVPSPCLFGPSAALLLLQAAPRMELARQQRRVEAGAISLRRRLALEDEKRGAN